MQFEQRVAPDNREQVQPATYGPEDGATYEEKLRAAHAFLRVHADQRYSSRSLESVLRAADRAEEIRSAGRVGHPEELPVVVELSRPHQYDEQTEVKSGGMMGVLVLRPEDGKIVLAVHRNYRRKKFGTFLLDTATSVPTDPSAWVGARNVVAQKFLLDYGFFPSMLNRSGAICYSQSDPGEAEGSPEERALSVLDDQPSHLARGRMRRARFEFTEGLDPEPEQTPEGTEASPGGRIVELDGNEMAPRNARLVSVGRTCSENTCTQPAHQRLTYEMVEGEPDGDVGYDPDPEF